MENIKIAIEVILVIMGFFFIAFNSYLKKKGENIATKKDIGIITNEIEKVKNEISYQNQKKLNFYFEKKKNLMDFFDNYFIWTENSINIAGSLLSHSNNEKVLRDLIS